MKTIIVLVLLLAFHGFASAQTKKVVYTCVMHPEVRKDKPGNCPKCDMTLIKKTVKVNTQKPSTQKPSEKPNSQVKEPKREETKEMDMDMHMSHQEKKDSASNEEIADEFIGSKVNMLPGKTVVYHLYVKDTTVTFTGKNKHAYAINGSIPA